MKTKKKKLPNKLSIPVEELVMLLDDREKLSLLRSLVDEFNGINILMKYRNGDIDDGTYIDGKDIKMGNYANSIIEVKLKLKDYINT